ncbi:MAG: nuclear transport factor 2 family protein [Chloroflexi bacterium]|nr:nuclear transport factor 2 family protein [Chloroflexota bacterium]
MTNQEQRLLDQVAILDVLHRYIRCVDTNGREDEFVDLFTPDATFEVRGNYPHVQRFIRGREGLKEFVLWLRQGKPKESYDKHVALNPVIDVRGDEAIVESNWIMMKASSAGMAVTGTGRMRDRFAKHGGRWRIKQRINDVEVLDMAPDSGETSPR